MVEIGLRIKGRPLHWHLEKAARRGAAVKILVWDNAMYVGKHDKLRAWRNRVRHLGIEVIVDSHTGTTSNSKSLLRRAADEIDGYYNLVKPPDGVFESLVRRNDSLVDSLLLAQLTRGDPSAVDISRWLRRTGYRIGAHHEKNIVVRGTNGLTAFCGGIDLNSNRLAPLRHRRPPPNEKEVPHFYHDVAVSVRGQPAKDILDKFLLRLRNLPDRKHERLLLNTSKVHVPYEPRTTETKVQIVGTFNGTAVQAPDRSFAEAYLSIIRNARPTCTSKTSTWCIPMSQGRSTDALRTETSNWRCSLSGTPTRPATSSIPNEAPRISEYRRSGAAPDQARKILYAVIRKDNVDALGDDAYQNKHRHHTGMHSKVLIADDEIAMVGSGNVNRRSFTLDSETSAIVFGGDFAKNLRMRLWKHTLTQFLVSYVGVPSPLEDPMTFPTSIREAAGKPSADGIRSTYLKQYEKANQRDVDVRVIEWIKDHQRLASLLEAHTLKVLLSEIWKMGGVPGVSLSRLLDDPDRYVPLLLDVLWDHVIDPSVSP